MNSKLFVAEIYDMKLSSIIQNFRAVNTKEKRMLFKPTIKGIYFEPFEVIAFHSANGFMANGFIVVVMIIMPLKS